MANIPSRKVVTESTRRHDQLRDPGIVPGGIRDRAMQIVIKRGPQTEDEEKTRASREYWARRHRQPTL